MGKTSKRTDDEQIAQAAANLDKIKQRKLQSACAPAPTPRSPRARRFRRHRSL
jgi:hypothetical protein